MRLGCVLSAPSTPCSSTLTSAKRALKENITGYLQGFVGTGHICSTSTTNTNTQKEREVVHHLPINPSLLPSLSTRKLHHHRCELWEPALRDSMRLGCICLHPSTPCMPRPTNATSRQQRHLIYPGKIDAFHIQALAGQHDDGPIAASHIGRRFKLYVCTRQCVVLPLSNPVIRKCVAPCL